MDKKGLSGRGFCAKYVTLAYTVTLDMSFVFTCKGDGFLLHEWTDCGQLAESIVEKAIEQ